MRTPIRASEKRRNADTLEIAWGRLVDAAWSDPEMIVGLQHRLADALDDPRLLGRLRPDEAAFAARLAHLGLGELLIRAVGGYRRSPDGSSGTGLEQTPQ